MNGCEENKKRGGVIAAVITSATALFGALFGQWNDGLDWRWFFGSSAPDAGFYAGRSADLVLELDDGWRFAPGDNAAWSEPGFVDAGWVAIEVPKAWESEGFRGHDGFGWYRRHFTLEAEAAARPLYLLLGEIDDADEVFVNGRRIGGTGTMPPHYHTAYDVPRAYWLPPDVLRSGADNVVAVRIYDDQQDGGIRRGRVGLYASELPAPLIDLAAGHWTLSTTDHPDYARTDVDESDFKPVSVPGYWHEQGVSLAHGHAWYRTHFDLTAPANADQLVLELGKVDDMDEVYLNGQLIGQTGSEDPTVDQADYYDQRRAYPFAASLLKPTGNVLAVRVFNGQSWGGISTGPIGIMTEADHTTYWRDLRSNRHRVWKPIWDWLLGR